MTHQFSDKLYTAICSERTLQANSNGFFMDFVHLVSERAGDAWIKNVFGKLKTDRDRFRSIYNCEKTKQTVIQVLSNVQEVYRKKSAEISQVKRLEAEKAFQNGDFKTSLMLYSQCVLRSPKTGDNNMFDSGGTLSLGLWERSQALMALREYSLALVDIQLALKENIPAIFKAEAYWRMAICYKAIGEENRAKVSFDLAETLIGNKKRIKDIDKDRSATFTQKKYNITKELPSIAGETHKIFRCASSKISLKQKEGLGRYAVANKEIKTGETLVVEEPYAACLLPDMFGTHCHHCFDRLKSPVGCPDCSNVAFCRPACKDAALSSYHQYECKFLDLLIGSGMSILSHTALRMITQNSLKKCLEIYRDSSKETVYSLCTNASKRSPEDFLQRTLMAAFLLRCLQKSGYFGNKDNIYPDDEECSIGELLLFHLQMLQFNAHEIFETRRMSDHCLKGSKPKFIGVAVYPTVALFNHECYPAVTRYFVGKNIVIKASRLLNPNEVIAENYGPIFTRKCLQDRQRSLSSRYWFTCQCNACIYNWPTLESGLEDFSKKIKCTNKSCSYYFTLPLSNLSITCPKCKETVCPSDQIRLLEWCEDQYKLGLEAMDSNQTQKAIDILSEAIDVFRRISCPPHKGTHLAQDNLQLCLASFGNISETLI